MILRPFASGEWFGSVVVSGLLITWIDTTNHVWKTNKTLIDTQEKSRYTIALLGMFLVGLALLILIIVNLITRVKWLNYSLVLDEITLLSMLICLSQQVIIKLINVIIRHK